MIGALLKAGSASSAQPAPAAAAPSSVETRTDQARARALSTICTHMPIKSLFKPELKIDLGTFIKDQMLFQRIAHFISHLGAVTAEEIANHFEGSELLREITAMFSTDADPYLHHLYQACAEALSDKKAPSRLSAAIEGRIFTLKNALVAQHTPQAIINSQTSSGIPLQNKSDIRAEGASWIKECIQMHLKSNEGSFQKQLTTLAEQLIPFVEKITKSYLQDLKKNPIDPILQQRHPKGLNYHGIAAAGIMECCLHVLGYQVQLAERSDLDPKATLTEAHSVVIVTGPDGSRYVVDPCYLQFHKDVHVDDSKLPKAPVLVLKEDEVVPYVENNLIRPWNEIHTKYLKNDSSTKRLLVQKDQQIAHALAKISDFEKACRMKPEEWVRTSFMRPWEVSSYIPVNTYRVYHDIFTDLNSAAKRTYELVKAMGIASLMGRASIAEIDKKMRPLLTRRPFKNDREALTLHGQHHLAPLENQLFFDTDQRNNNLFLSAEVNAYYRSLCKIVNPERKDLSVIYACAGSDTTSVLLATDATELIFVDASPVSLKKLKDMLENQKGPDAKPPSDPTYISMRSSMCAAKSGHDLAGNYSMAHREHQLILDLRIMGVDLTQVKISSFKGVARIDFPWNSFENKVKQRTLLLVTADITKPDQYPFLLKRKIEQGFDIFYMKGSYHAPLDYPQFLPQFATGLKTGGWLMTSDWTYDMRHINPQECLQASELSFKEPESEENKLFNQLFSHPQDAFLQLDQRANNPEKRTAAVTFADWRYWTLLNLRQKGI